MGQQSTYRNPWHKANTKDYGPAEFTTDVRPVAYGDCLIYQRLPGTFDVVRDGVCVTQRAGMNGAKQFIDGLVVAA